MMKRLGPWVVLMSILFLLASCGGPKVASVTPDGKPIQVFRKSKLIYQSGSTPREASVDLAFYPDKLLISGAQSAEIPYASITSLSYERSTHPRVKTAVFLSPLALLSKSKKHWLYIFQESDSYMMKLDKKEYQRILMNLRSKTGMEIEELTD